MYTHVHLLRPPMLTTVILPNAQILITYYHSIPESVQPCIGPVRFAEKTSRNTVPVDLLWEKYTVSTEKQAQKDEYSLIH